MTHHTTQHTHGATDMTQAHSILNGVDEGMAVYDANRDQIGTVEFVHFGSASATQLAHGTREWERRHPWRPGMATFPANCYRL